MTRFFSNPVLLDWWTNPKYCAMRNRVLYGGRSSSKSWDAATAAIMYSTEFSLKFLCARQFQNKIEESVYTLLKSRIKNLGLSDQFNILNNKIINLKTGSEFIFYGLWRHIDEIRSTEGVDICWIEEAHALTKTQWDILEPTLRNDYSQFWVVFNPNIKTDFVYQRFIVHPPERTTIRKINYDQNRFLSKTILKVIEAKKAENYEDYEHFYLGVPRDNDDSVIIKRTWLNAAIDAHKALNVEPEGRHRLGFDVADDGGDRCVNVHAHGSVCLGMESWKAHEDELLKSCKRTYANAREWQAEITYDATGIGAHCGAKFAEINEESNTTRPVAYQKFVAGGKVIKPDQKYTHDIKNKDFFCNLKAQSWWSVADRLRNTWDAITNGTHYDPADLISISSDIPNLEALLTELSTPKKDYDNAGKIKVESKKDLEEREIESPDLADAFVMAFAPAGKSRGVLDVLMD